MGPYRLDEVSFSMAAISINKKRIVCLAGIFYDSLRRCVSELVERTDDKVLKNITRVEIVLFIDIKVLERH